MAFNMVCTFLFVSREWLCFKTSCSINSHPRLITPIENSLTSFFIYVVAPDSRVRIAHRTLQISGQRRNFSNQLLI
jgi:hypothetical protein